MIEAINLTKRYKDKLAVDDISFTVEPGSVVGLLGPNGAGKTTTMRLMLGLDRGEGETYYDGKKLDEYRHPLREVGLLLDAKAFHPTRTARNHLQVLADSAGISSKRVQEVLEIVGIADVADSRPGNFSLGMGQRLGLAAAILGEPKYLILDEPGNGLDPEGISWLRRFMQDYAAKGNVVFVSSHLLSEMSQLASDVIVIGKGKLLANTSIKELLNDKAAQATFVRTRSLKKLEKALIEAGIKTSHHEDGLLAEGVDTDAVGKVAHKSGVLLYELSNRSASLEDVFLRLTADSQEYQSKTAGDK